MILKNLIIETVGLNKTKKNIALLKDINLKIEEGKIYALIGRNGAGKTSLIRVLTGLSFKTSGEIKIFNKSYLKYIESERSKIGCLIEGPTVFDNMTAYENLETERICRGLPDSESINEVIKLVGLEDSLNKKVKNFSLGMKQRLGIAMALLSNPRLVILDEPTNGLDPMGIVEMRNLLKKLNEEYNKTIIISSHLLSELYQVATDYIIINDGEIIENLTLDELNKKCKKHIAIKVKDTELAATIIESKLNIKNFIVDEDGLIKIYDYLEKIEDISKELSSSGIIITKIDTKVDSLEEYFIKLIGEKRND